MSSRRVNLSVLNWKTERQIIRFECLLLCLNLLLVRYSDIAQIVLTNNHGCIGELKQYNFYVRD